MDGIIFDDIKKMLGISLEDDGFDTDVLININSALTSLSILGVGPIVRLSINKTTPWASINVNVDDTFFDSVKTYVYLKVRLAFDPPQNSFDYRDTSSRTSRIQSHHVAA